MEGLVYNVHAAWDPDGEVWVATSDDVPGLTAEAPTVEALAEKLRAMIPELLEANEIRKDLSLKVGDEVVLVLEDGAGRLLSQEEAIRRAQLLVRAHVPAGRSLSEELLQERQRESGNPRFSG